MWKNISASAGGETTCVREHKENSRQAACTQRLTGHAAPCGGPVTRFEADPARICTAAQRRVVLKHKRGVAVAVGGCNSRRTAGVDG